MRPVEQLTKSSWIIWHIQIWHGIVMIYINKHLCAHIPSGQSMIFMECLYIYICPFPTLQSWYIWKHINTHIPRGHSIWKHIFAHVPRGQSLKYIETYICPHSNRIDNDIYGNILMSTSLQDSQWYIWKHICSSKNLVTTFKIVSSGFIKVKVWFKYAQTIFLFRYPRL